MSLATSAAGAMGSMRPPGATRADGEPAVLELAEWDLLRGVTLPRGAVQALRERYASQIGLSPSWDVPGAYDLQGRGYVGAIALPDLRVMLRPKVPLNTLVYMLAQTNRFPDLAEDVAPFARTGLTELMARWLIAAGAPLVERHLLRRYQPREDRPPYVRGQIDVAGSMRPQMGGRPELVCRFDEHTPDVVENQLLLAASSILLHMPDLSPWATGRLRRMVAMLDEVRARIPARWERRAIVWDRLNARYRPALRLAGWILDRSSPELPEREMSARFQAFVIDMAVVFQEFVYTRLAALLREHDYTCRAEPPMYVDTARRLFVTLPDILVRAPSGEVVILDTKYKNLRAAYGPSPEDVYQVVTYCVTRRARHGLLVYPASEPAASFATQIANAGITLTLFPIDLGEGPDALEGSVQRLADFVMARATAPGEAVHRG